MGENTEIAWTHSTFNPWHGCQPGHVVTAAMERITAELEADRVTIERDNGLPPDEQYGIPVRR